jgi:hypothetical protein
MIASRLTIVAASVIVTLAAAFPAAAQGKSGKSHGKAASPSLATTSLPAAAAAGAPVPAAPFAWIDDASVMAPATLWFGVSMVQWHGGGANEVILPAFDGSVGLAPRLQIGASVPRVEGGLGTTFFNAKIGLFNGQRHGVKLAVGPTLEVLSRSAVQNGQSRTQWGIPVSAEIDRGSKRIFGSSGYFSPGIWFAGAGVAGPIGERLGVSASFSRAWTTAPASPRPGLAPRRNDLSGSASFDVTPSIAIFGSVGQTIGTAAESGAGTTISFGLSLTAGPVVFTR